MSRTIIVLDRSKHDTNVGGILRLAYNYDCASVYIIGARYKKQCSDTPNTIEQLPVYEVESFNDISIPKSLGRDSRMN